MEQNFKDRIINSLIQRIGQFRCPMCGKGPFTILDGLSMISVQDDTKILLIGSNKQIVSAILVCNNCGFTSFHNLPALGIMDIDDNNL